MDPGAREVAARPLTPREDAVLRVLITWGTSADEDVAVSDEDRARWLGQVPHTRAGRGCGCGTCPSIELTDTAGGRPQMEASRVVLEGSTAGALLLLFLDDDRLSYLELAPLGDGTTFHGFPHPASIHFNG